jgi:hypothetical protein
MIKTDYYDRSLVLVEQLISDNEEELHRLNERLRRLDTVKYYAVKVDSCKYAAEACLNVIREQGIPEAIKVAQQFKATHTTVCDDYKQELTQLLKDKTTAMQIERRLDLLNGERKERKAQQKRLKKAYNKTVFTPREIEYLYLKARSFAIDVKATEKLELNELRAELLEEAKAQAARWAEENEVTLEHMLRRNVSWSFTNHKPLGSDSCHELMRGMNGLNKANGRKVRCMAIDESAGRFLSPFRAEELGYRSGTCQGIAVVIDYESRRMVSATAPHPRHLIQG